MYLKVISHPNAKKEKILQKSADSFEVWVSEKAQRNMANKRILRLLSSYFKVPEKKIRIINGHHHPHKLLVLEDKI